MAQQGVNDTESALLRAVRNRIRDYTQFESHQVNVEYDAMAPSAAGNVYVCVLSGGVQAGPEYIAGTVIDELVSVRIAVVMRAPMYPRDRRRNLYFNTLTSINAYLQEIKDQIDFQYTVNDDANTILTDEAGSSEGFIEPLQWSGNGHPQAIGAEFFADSRSESQAGIMREATYIKARRIQTRTYS